MLDDVMKAKLFDMRVNAIRQLKTEFLPSYLCGFLDIKMNDTSKGKKHSAKIWAGILPEIPGTFAIETRRTSGAL